MYTNSINHLRAFFYGSILYYFYPIIFQAKCSEAMSLWGYKLMDSSVQQDNFESKAVLEI